MADESNDLSKILEVLPTELSGLSAATKDADIPSLTRAIGDADVPALTKSLQAFSGAITNDSVLRKAILDNTTAINSLSSKIDSLAAKQDIMSRQAAAGAGVAAAGFAGAAGPQQNPQLTQIITILNSLLTNQQTQSQDNKTKDKEQKVEGRGVYASFLHGYMSTRKKILEAKEASEKEGGPEYHYLASTIGHGLSNILPQGMRNILGGGLGMASTFVGGAALGVGGFLLDQLQKAFVDHVMSIPKSWNTLRQAQILTGNFRWSDVNTNASYVGASLPWAGTFAGSGDNFLRFHADYRFRAGRMGYSSDEFYKRYLDFVGAGIRGATGSEIGGVEQYLMPALAAEKVTGGQLKFSTEFLAAINKSTQSTFDLAKHLQILDITVKRNIYISEKQLQTFVTSLATGVRGTTGNNNADYARAISMFAPAMSANLVNEQEAASIVQSSRGLSLDQRARIAAFTPQLSGTGILGGAQRILENSASIQGLMQNLGYFQSMVRQYTGGRNFMSLTDDERGLAIPVLSNMGIPTQLMNHPLFGKLIDSMASAKDISKIQEDLKSPELKALEVTAQGIASLEDPLKQIRDAVVGFFVNKFSRDPSRERLVREFSYDGLFTEQEYARANAARQQEYRDMWIKNEKEKAATIAGYKEKDFDTVRGQVLAIAKSKESFEELNEQVDRLTASFKQAADASDDASKRGDTTVAGTDVVVTNSPTPWIVKR